MRYSKRFRRLTAVLSALIVLLQPLAVPLATAQQGTAPAQPAAKPTAQPAAKPTTTPAAKPATTPAAKPATTADASATPIDGGWPRYYTLPSGSNIVVYQPQIATWDKQAHLVAFSAVSRSSPKASEKPAVGTVKLEADTTIALTDRLVRLQKVSISEANFQTLPKDQLREVVAEIENAIPDEDRIIALDRILANMDKSQITPKNVDGIKADPPRIFFSKTPAVIVILDGEPVWSPIRENDLEFAVNTNWDLFRHGPTSTFYLLNEDTWLKATDLNGPWSPGGKLPESFNKLPADENFKEIKSNVPGKSVSASKMPRVFVTQQPGELILLDGEPKYGQVAKTELMWVSNTESDVFRMGKTGAVSYLVAGRWFSAPDFTGPWTFATPSLPEAFKQIPAEHERARVLASVPGTDQAAEAVLLAQIPQTARVNRKETKAPDVAFQGNPQFETIQPTTVQRAVNTDKDVFKFGDSFYMCYQGVWFIGKSATGPWEVATSIPQEIYKIPISSPSHHVTYVTVEDDDDDDWVVYAAAAGYTGLMIGWGCAVWGSGWYYPPYIGYGGYYPMYYPGFHTYGYSAWYNPYTGGFGRSAAVYGPYGGAGVAARYNPRTGTYARGAAAWGPYGARGAAHAYNPRTGTYAQTRQGSNVYGSWGSTSVQRGDDWAQTNRYTNRRTGTTTRTVRTDEGSAVSRRGPGGGTVAVGDQGNVYAGRDGNAYRREDGTWQKYDNGGWSNTEKQPSGERPRPNEGTSATSGRPAQTGAADRATTDQLNRDARARTEGTQRTTDYGNYKSGGATRHPSGGGYGGGGARRGGGGGGRRR